MIFSTRLYLMLPGEGLPHKKVANALAGYQSGSQTVFRLTAKKLSTSRLLAEFSLSGEKFNACFNIVSFWNSIRPFWTKTVWCPSPVWLSESCCYLAENCANNKIFWIFCSCNIGWNNNFVSINNWLSAGINCCYPCSGQRPGIPLVILWSISYYQKEKKFDVGNQTHFVLLY